MKASLCDEDTDKATRPTSGKTASEAAMAAANNYVETLHNKLQHFLNDLIRQVLTDASASHFKSEKLKEMHATSDYVPTICRSVGIKLQAVPEVTESTGYKSLNDELKEEIEATRRDWATRFVFPVYDTNVKALRKRFQLSFCRLLSSAAKGFIAQVGIEGYDATVAIMDLLSMHDEMVVAPLNVTTHDFLVVLKETMGATIIPSPTVEHSLSEVLHKINGTSSSEDREQEDGSTMTMNTAHAAPAAIGIYIDEQLNEAESAVAGRLPT
jgi:Txe/YoeB family toxin of Txe-Axe toxin-antitoxin module